MTKLVARPLLSTPARLARLDEQAGGITLDDDALCVMTDLRRHRTVTIAPDETLGFAEKLMKYAGVRLLLVIDGRGLLTGLVTYRDLHGERALAAAAREKTPHQEITITQIMTPAARIETLPRAALKHKQVRDIVELLREHGRQHALVTEPAENQDTLIVCGIFSLTQIGRQLGLSISANERVQSFAEIEHLIAAS